MNVKRRQLRSLDYLDHMLDAVQSAQRFVKRILEGRLSRRPEDTEGCHT